MTTQAKGPRRDAGAFFDRLGPIARPRKIWRLYDTAVGQPRYVTPRHTGHIAQSHLPVGAAGRFDQTGPSPARQPITNEGIARLPARTLIGHNITDQPRIEDGGSGIS